MNDYQRLNKKRYRYENGTWEFIDETQFTYEGNFPQVIEQVRKNEEGKVLGMIRTSFVRDERGNPIEAKMYIGKTLYVMKATCTYY